MNSYDLSRNFWNWAFDNPEKISTNHAAIYFFAIEHCNRLGWKKKFGFPSQMTMDAIGIKKHSTYIRYFNDLVEFGFFTLIQKSTNQYSSNIICLTNALPKKGQAMDKAMLMHGDKQKEYKQTNKQENKEQESLNDIFLTCDKDKQQFLKTWIEFRKEIKKPIKVKSTLESLIKRFNKEIPAKCFWTVNHSIENSYQGLFWDKYQTPKGEEVKSTVFKPSNNHRHG